MSLPLYVKYLYYDVPHYQVIKFATHTHTGTVLYSCTDISKLLKLLCIPFCFSFQQYVANIIVLSGIRIHYFINNNHFRAIKLHRHGPWLYKSITPIFAIYFEFCSVYNLLSTARHEIIFSRWLIMSEIEVLDFIALTACLD